MSSWGASTTDESKPKFLTDEEKRNCYATDRGWTIPAGGNPDGEREVIAAIGGLSGATKLVEASISSSRLVTTALGAAAGGDFSAEVIYNELVTVTGTPQVTVTSTGANHTLNYASGSGTNRLTFTSTIAADAAAENDVLTLGANSVALNGGAINDTGSGNAAVLTHGAGTGSVTVAA
jgi:hypothetical protein|tara:strand:- start:35 stop:568 length:534 start_codon:yes stop_codon:yes gene_type:complete